MWDILQQIIERWGFPVGFCVWLMMGVTRDLREIRAELKRSAVLNAVILKTLDVPDSAVGSANNEEGK